MRPYYMSGAEIIYNITVVMFNVSFALFLINTFQTFIEFFDIILLFDIFFFTELSSNYHAGKILSYTVRMLGRHSYTFFQFLHVSHLVIIIDDTFCKHTKGAMTEMKLIEYHQHVL